MNCFDRPSPAVVTSIFIHHKTPPAGAAESWRQTGREFKQGIRDWARKKLEKGKYSRKKQNDYILEVRNIWQMLQRAIGAQRAQCHMGHMCIHTDVARTKYSVEVASRLKILYIHALRSLVSETFFFWKESREQ